MQQARWMKSSEITENGRYFCSIVGRESYTGFNLLQVSMIGGTPFTLLPDGDYYVRVVGSFEHLDLVYGPVDEPPSSEMAP